MRFVDEFSDPTHAQAMLDEIDELVSDAVRPWALMEVCGGQTHSIIRNGIDQLLPNAVELIHGPGCPVCVTPIDIIDLGLDIAAKPGVVFCSFGDMLRVPGSGRDLFSVRADGADVRVVYSALDALAIARDNPENEVVFFGVGFETTAPGNALVVRQASEAGIENFSVLVSHVLVPPAIDAIASSADSRVDAFLAAGHVCTVMGTDDYHRIAARHGVPIVVTGFEPLDVLDGIRRAVRQLEAGTAYVENAYGRAVQDEGNAVARDLLSDVFDVTDRDWRGIGQIGASGWRLSERYRRFDAAERFGEGPTKPRADLTCRAGEVLLGQLKPPECEAFGSICTPRHPLGATMVSDEGACAAYYQYRQTPIGADRG